MKQRKNNSGIAILLTILIIGILLSIVTAFSAIFSAKIRISADTKFSVGAIYAAESGIECCLYKTLKNNSYSCNNLGNSGINIGATFDTGATCLTNTIKSVGKYNGVSRAIEVNYN